MRTFDNLTTEEEAVLIKMLRDRYFQDLIGTGEWGLSEAEENILWDLIKALPDE